MPPKPGRPLVPKGVYLPRGPGAAHVSRRWLQGRPKTHSKMRRVRRPPNPPQSKGVSNKKRVVQKAPSRPLSDPQLMPTPNSKANSKVSTVKCLAKELPHTCPPKQKQQKPNRTICRCRPSRKLISTQTTLLKYCLNIVCKLESGVRNWGSRPALASLSM